MKRSVNFMALAHCSCGVGLGLFGGCTVLSIDDRRAVLELHLAAGHDHGAGLDPLEDRDLIARGCRLW